MASNLRRAGVVLAGAGTYAATVYLTYSYLYTSKADRDAANARLSASGGSRSYVSDPDRTQTFERIAWNYDDQIGKDELVMGINLMRRWLLYFHARGEVLEVGAGTGRNLPYYPGGATVKRVVLTDTSDKMLLRAREKLRSFSAADRGRFVAVVADAGNLSGHADSSFDTVVDTFGLCSFDDPVSVLREIRRVCRPNGKILLLEHGRTKRYEGLSRYLDENAERHAKNWGCVWNRDIDAMLEEAGLFVETLTTWHFGTTYYAVCRPGTKGGIEKLTKDEDGVLTTSKQDLEEMFSPSISLLSAVGTTDD